MTNFYGDVFCPLARSIRQVWLVVVVPTDQGSNPGIAPKKNPLAVLAGLWLWCVAGPGYGAVRRPGLRYTPAQVRFGLYGHGPGFGDFSRPGSYGPFLIATPWGWFFPHRSSFFSDFRLKKLLNQLLRMENSYWKSSSLQLDYKVCQFFPEANEVTFARQSAFEGCSLKLDYLTKPSLFEDFGFTTKVKMADRVRPEDETFLVAYPYFNVNEMLVVEELYKDAVVGTNRKLIIFNGELDRIRSGYYPSFFYPKLAVLSKTFLPKLDAVYYIHNFKGVKGGTLFRCYPGPWKVLRKATSGSYICLHQQEEMPSLKEVALDILPSV
ncbi:uncharacterized protein LOC112889188 isoform X3 [Panicum hallii]|uniref:uncharacterized protein LOC112889188 isoform X3 n=1 Tax=Panicum hallii TaxID=206008 RepID=UPI000DF4D8A4|nr:uncharacterized protein LOC112889188 isoform X3 [Panicum hallii]